MFKIFSNIVTYNQNKNTPDNHKTKMLWSQIFFFKDLNFEGFYDYYILVVEEQTNEQFLSIAIMATTSIMCGLDDHEKTVLLLLLYNDYFIIVCYRSTFVWLISDR